MPRFRLKAYTRPCGLLAAAAAALAACRSPGGSPAGGGTGPSGSAASSPVAQPPAASGPLLEPRRTALGLILTDGREFTLYAFGADRGATPRWTGLCAGRQEEPGEAGPVPGSQAPHEQARARP